MDGTSGEFASIDEVAGQLEQDPSALAMAELVRSMLFEETSLSAGDVQAVGVPVTLVPGRALLLIVSDYEGAEFEIFVKAWR